MQIHMRTLEILLIIVLLLQFSIMVFGIRRPPKVRLYSSLLVLGVIILQLVFEGFRWQLIPAYASCFFIVLTFLLPSSSWKVLKMGRNFLLSLMLILAIALPMLLPVLEFENNQGEYSVGVKNIQFVDSDREEILTKDSTDYRNLTYRIFYPSTAQEGNFVDYIPNFERVKSAYQKKLGWPLFLLDYLEYFKIEATENAVHLDAQKFPLIIYSHGLTNNYTEAAGRMMKLAAKGYVVAAINHTYSSDYAILANGKVVGYKALSQLGDPIDKVDSVKTIIANQWLTDVRSVIGQLKQSKESQAIDFENIGLIGFSAGGTMATLGSYKIDHVKAAINLDGTPRGINFMNKPQCPQLFMFREPEEFSDAQIKAWGITREMIDAPIRLINQRAAKILSATPEASYIVRIPGTKHSNFIEYALISPLSQELDIGGSIDSWKCYDMINEMLYAFLDKNLKNKPVEFPEFQGVEIIKS